MKKIITLTEEDLKDIIKNCINEVNNNNYNMFTSKKRLNNDFLSSSNDLNNKTQDIISKVEMLLSKYIYTTSMKLATNNIIDAMKNNTENRKVIINLELPNVNPQKLFSNNNTVGITNDSSRKDLKKAINNINYLNDEYKPKVIEGLNTIYNMFSKTEKTYRTVGEYLKNKPSNVNVKNNDVKNIYLIILENLNNFNNEIKKLIEEND